MVTRVPRVAVTFSPAARGAVQALARAQGRTMSKVVAEVVEEVWPLLRQAAVLIEAANKVPEEMRANLRAMADRTEREMRCRR